MNRLVIAITGASGSIYARLVIEKLLIIKDQWDDLAIVMTENAKQVWETELQNDEYKKLEAGVYKVDSVPDMAEYSGKRFEYMLDKPKNK